MPLYSTPGGPFYFAHVPRTGGSNLEDYLEARFGPPAMIDRDWMRAWTGGAWRHDSLLSSPQHLTSADVARLVPKGTACLAVVRDPAARIVSEFRFQARRGLRRRRLTELGFSTWLRLVLAGARRDPRIFDNHLRPQVDMVPAEAAVFPLEAGLGAPVAWLDEISGTAAPDLRIATGEPGPDPKPVAPSAQDLRLIACFYADDYSRFGFTPRDPGAHDRLAAARTLLSAVAAPVAIRMYFRGQL